jgi:TolA-binding protein
MDSREMRKIDVFRSGFTRGSSKVESQVEQLEQRVAKLRHMQGLIEKAIEDNVQQINEKYPGCQIRTTMSRISSIKYSLTSREDTRESWGRGEPRLEHRIQTLIEEIPEWKNLIDLMLRIDTYKKIEQINKLREEYERQQNPRAAAKATNADGRTAQEYYAIFKSISLRAWETLTKKRTLLPSTDEIFDSPSDPK